MHSVVAPSEMKRDENYRSFYPIAKIVFLGVVPLLALTYLNRRIFNAVRSSSHLVKENHRREQQPKENDLARILIGITLLFIVCHSFRVTIEIDNIRTAKTLTICYKLCIPPFSVWSALLDSLSKLMMVINSASNMVIYCCLNATIRKLIFPCIERSQRKFSQFLSTQPTYKQSTTTCIEETPLNKRNI